MKPFGTVGLAVTSFDSAGDGVAYVGRLLRAALRELAHEVVIVELGLSSLRPHSVTRRGRFITAIARAQMRHEPDWWMYSHADIARAHYTLPHRLRRPYAVFIHGHETWLPLLDEVRLEVLRGATVRCANSRHTARRSVVAHPQIGVVEVCQLALLPPETHPRDDVLIDRAGSGYALIVGRMNASERHKGHDELLHAWPSVMQRVPGARLVVVGGGDDVGRLRALTRELGIANAVLFTGVISDRTLAGLRQKARLFVMPATNEGFGLVYLEAMAAGLPCIGTTADAAAEIIVDGVTGLLVQPHDPTAIADAVARLLIDPGYATRLGETGRARAERDYSYVRFRGRLQTALAPLATYPRRAPLYV